MTVCGPAQAVGDRQGREGPIGRVEGCDQAMNHGTFKEGAGRVMDQHGAVAGPTERPKAVADRSGPRRTAGRQSPAGEIIEGSGCCGLGSRRDDDDHIRCAGPEHRLDGPSDDRLAAQRAPLLGFAGTASCSGGDDDCGEAHGAASTGPVLC